MSYKEFVTQLLSDITGVERLCRIGDGVNIAMLSYSHLNIFLVWYCITFSINLEIKGRSESAYRFLNNGFNLGD